MAKEEGSKAGKVLFIISGIVVNGGLLYFAPSLQEKAEHIEQNPHLYRESEKFDDGKGPIGRDERQKRRMIEKNLNNGFHDNRTPLKDQRLPFYSSTNRYRFLI